MQSLYIKKTTIHASGSIKWHRKYAQAVKEGFYHQGINANITTSRTRESDVSVLMGPNLWKHIENDGGDFIMLNRKFLGFKESDVHDNCAVSWNGFNGMGIFGVNANNLSQNRLDRYLKPEEIEPLSLNHDKFLLCRQHDTGRSEIYNDINKWYRKVHRMVKPGKLKIRNKITLENVGPTEFMRSLKEDLSDVKAVFSLNSIVSVEALILGKGIITEDKTNPCYAIVDRLSVRPEFLKYLAHCQWHIDEIRNGSCFADMIFGPYGPRLHEWTPSHWGKGKSINK
jgi:hypothetical protein